MRLTSKISLLLSLSLFISLNLFGQADTTKIKRFDNELNAAVATDQLKSNSFNSKVAPNANIDLTINNNLNTNAVNKNLNKYASKNNGNFLMETLPEDRDIVGKKYWEGKDVTHKRLKSTKSLGTITTKAKTVRVECRDHSYVDGDIIKIYINEQSLDNNVVLRGSIFSVYLNLEQGYNRIDFQALNQGLSGPNTAELRLYDEHDNLIAAKEWNLLTGETATIGVIQQR